ncbi:MAG: HlyD family secretion protein [Pseudolabrys sp.]|nr:HlyD family secretion protein [Pseudolabrys sp.]
MDARTPKDERADRQERSKEDSDQNKRSARSDEQKSEKRKDDKSQDKPKPSLIARARQHPWIVMGVVAGLVVVLIAALLWWLHARQYESTDDAFVDTRTATISPQVTGTVSEILVNDNLPVHAGDVLIRLDSVTFRAQLAQAQAQVEQAVANIANIDAQIGGQQSRIEQAQKQVTQAQAADTFARQQFDRAQELARSGNGTVQQAQQTESNMQQAAASLSAAADNVTASIKQLETLKAQRQGAAAQLESAKAQYTQANVNLGYTTLVAPTDGRVTKLTAAIGSYVAPGQALMMFVPRVVWVTANFKETQLARMSMGQPVDMTIDAFPGRHFAGHVDSVQAGSGTAFSLLPAENATGNYVKVVQRVPVKIVFEDLPTDITLGPGMSVVPTVKVR